MSLKSLREALCKQQAIQRGPDAWPDDVRVAVSHLIAKIDYHRPLASNCKHGNLHTPTCGCEDKP